MDGQHYHEPLGEPLVDGGVLTPPLPLAPIPLFQVPPRSGVAASGWGVPFVGGRVKGETTLATAGVAVVDADNGWVPVCSAVLLASLSLHPPPLTPTTGGAAVIPEVAVASNRRRPPLDLSFARRSASSSRSRCFLATSSSFARSASRSAFAFTARSAASALRCSISALTRASSSAISAASRSSSSFRSTTSQLGSYHIEKALPCSFRSSSSAASCSCSRRSLSAFLLAMTLALNLTFSDSIFLVAAARAV